MKLAGLRESENVADLTPSAIEARNKEEYKQIKRRPELAMRILESGPDDIALHDFADSSVGRSILEAMIHDGVDQDLVKLLQDAFDKFKAERDTIPEL